MKGFCSLTERRNHSTGAENPPMQLGDHKSFHTLMQGIKPEQWQETRVLTPEPAVQPVINRRYKT